MLPDRLCQLLTAYVDGELSARQQRAVLRLLNRSAEARAVLRQLQEDTDRLRQLPRKQLAPDFAAQVLLAINEQGIHPAPRPRRMAPVGVPSWLGLAAAAAVLLIIGTASFVYFAVSPLEPGNSGTQANNRPTPPAPDDVPAPPDRHTAQAPARELLPAPRPDQVVQHTPPAPVPDGTTPDPAPPDGGYESILTAPTPKMELFPQIADTKLALILSLAHLDRPQPQKELDDELRKDVGYRIELACLEGGRAMDRLRAAFQAQGIRLVIDQLAQDRLKLKLRTNYALYVENLTRDEVARILRRLAADDKKAKPRPQFDKVVLQRMAAEDYQEVSKLLGVDPKTLAAPKPKSPRDVDLHQPLSKGTAEQVEQALKGGRPAPGKPVAKAGERLAVVVPYNPVRPRPASPQVKQFLEGRKERVPDTVQLVLVLRGSSG